MPEPAQQPTIYFIGVTTRQSSILKIFPRWASLLGLGDAGITGVDFPLHAPREDYRAMVQFIQNDPRSCGALVTTHKIDLYNACLDLFAEADPLARATQETSCLSKRVSDGSLVCHAKDPVSSGLAMEAFFPAARWRDQPADAFLIGAGGAAIAISYYLLAASPHRPRQVIIADRSAQRLAEIRKIHEPLGVAKFVSYRQIATAADNDRLLSDLAPGSLVVNATGLGKDGPGSPISDDAVFPEGSAAWELNYRGELQFWHQATRQADARKLHVEDGWIYFLHGWTRVIAEVFHIDIPTQGPRFDQLSAAAADFSRSQK